MLKRTPLFAAHQKLGGRMVEFGGWEMPVQYSSIVDEHHAVRRAAGLFDISHMGEVRVTGPGALEFLNRLLTNDLRKLTAGLGQYTIMCNERGGAIDDLYAYRLADQEYLLIINASRIEPDVAWMQQQLPGSSVKFENISDATGAVALQGPRAVEFIDRCFPSPAKSGTVVAKPSELKKNQIASFPFQAQPIYVARTGYTGEDGFEIVAPANIIESVWTHILSHGHAHCAQPAGLGARDTLRTEVCYPLYGHELDENTSPIEAGLGFFVALEKGDFIGRAALEQQKKNGPKKKCVAFKMTDKSAPPRPHYKICKPGAGEVGEVVSGTQSPSLGTGIGMGYVPIEFAAPGTPVEIEIRGKRSPAVVAKKPLYQKPS
jgi:aminomethyltransferase